ncbi:MAG TPA: phenylacetate--CoA ligase family protein, partial [Blastocatellia bacterium]
MATLAQEEGTQVHSPRSIVCASESLYPYQRERIESMFKTKVWDWYGLTELVGNASQCELHDGYHVSMEQGYFEVIGEDGEPAERGQTGEVVATGLHNFSMPLLRYRTGDLAELSPEPCRCGRPSHTIKSIRGRLNEFIETPNGVRLTATALNVHGDTWENVIQFQYVQKSASRVQLRIVKGAAYSETNERRILRQMTARFGDEIRIGIEYVPEILRSARGKSPLIVQEREDSPVAASA